VLRGRLLNSRRVLAVLSVLLLAALAGGALSSALARPVVVEAKKKCKKARKGAGRGKCKRVKAAPFLTLHSPIVRADLTWSGGADLDLHAWDADGNHDGWDGNLFAYDVGIPGTAYEQLSSNEERIVDNRNPSTRPYAFGICYYPDPDVGTAHGDMTFLTATGASLSFPVTIDIGAPYLIYVAGENVAIGSQNWCGGP
jgi:hypothetical protein